MHDSGPPRKTLHRETAHVLPLVALIGGNVALAFGPWFVRLADVGPVAAAFWRVALAAPLLIVFAYATSRRPFRHVGGLWLLIVIGGVVFAADLASWHLGILRTTLANATLFGNSATLMFPIYGFLVARAWPTRSQGLALTLAAVGAALLLGRSYEMSSKNLFGDLLCLAAGTLYTAYIIVMVRVRAAMAPVPALTLATIASLAPLALSAWALGEVFWPHQWGVLIGLALASQIIGQGLMIYSISLLSPLVVGIALLSQPIVGGAIGWIVYGERLGTPDAIGAVLVAIALVLVSGSRRVAPAAEEPKSA